MVGVIFKRGLEEKAVPEGMTEGSVTPRTMATKSANKRGLDGANAMVDDEVID
jgi:hypothetical protein